VITLRERVEEEAVGCADGEKRYGLGGEGGESNIGPGGKRKKWKGAGMEGARDD
jgi:hypothetical protein